MDSIPYQLHILFFPYMAHGHMIPMVDMARLFARRGVKASIVSTPLNAPLFSKTIERDGQLGLDISIHTIKFPSAEAGLPEGCENLSSLTSPDMLPNFLKAIGMLQQPLEKLLEEYHPSCLVADMVFPWATEAANKLGIPRLFFNGTGFFPMCVFDSIKRYEPHKGVDSDFEPFVVPGLPDQIKLTRSQLPTFIREGTENELTKLMDEVSESIVNSHGVLTNSFVELEPAYSEHYRMEIKRKTWHVGPLSLCNRDMKDKAERGSLSSTDEHECMRWLAKKNPNSVLYICFGSFFNHPAAQLLELAMALEASGQNFIWVVRERKQTKLAEKEEEWLPEGFEKRMEGKGLIISGWAPQVLILDHEAVGGFMTHCGWNSTLEGVTAGVPMVTWPLAAEQFCNEALITDVLKIGVGVGALEWSRCEQKLIVRKEAIEKAITRLMVGEEAEEMRNRAKVLKEMARRATEEGGSSYSDLTALLEELRALETSKQEFAAN